MEFEFSPEAQAQIEDLAAEAPRSKADQISAAFTLARLIVEMETRTEPLVIVAGSIEISNQPYRTQRELWFKREIAKLAPEQNTLITDLWESAQLKPSFMGVGIDLKPILARAKELFRNKI